MKTSYLFPNRFKLISGVLFAVSLALFVTYYCADKYLDFEYKTQVFAIVGDTGLLGDSDWFGWVENSIIDEILFTIVITSGLIFAFSKEKAEDEMVASIRLNSLVKATIANYVILLFLYLTVYGFSFLTVLNGAMFSQLLIFIVLFRINMYRFNKFATNEE
ncbi:MAG: hypothetical protein V4581_15645 [Bacteroidota bacterium]